MEWANMRIIFNILIGAIWLGCALGMSINIAVKKVNIVDANPFIFIKMWFCDNPLWLVILWSILCFYIVLLAYIYLSGDTFQHD